VNPPYNFWRPEAIAPFLVATVAGDGTRPLERHYYFWFFGYVAKLPYERELPIKEQIHIFESIKKQNAEFLDEIRRIRQ